MSYSKWLLVLAGAAFSNLIHAQIVIGGEEPTVIEKSKTKVEKVVKEKVVDTTKYKTELFVGASVMSTNRSLSTADNPLFAKPVGEREKEVGLVRPSVHLGIRQKLNTFLMLEASVSFYQNGQSYSFKEVDTAHTYTLINNNVGVGLKLFYYKSINKLDVSVGAGVMPNFRLKDKRTDDFTNNKGTTTSSEVKSKENLNGIGLNIVANAGVQYNFHPRVGAYLMVEYRTDLVDQFAEYQPLKQKNFGIGGTVGVALKF